MCVYVENDFIMKDCITRECNYRIRGGLCVGKESLRGVRDSDLRPGGSRGSLRRSSVVTPPVASA